MLDSKRKEELRKRIQEARARKLEASPVKRFLKNFLEDIEEAGNSEEEVTITNPDELQNFGISELVLFVTGIPDDKVEDFIAQFEQLVGTYTGVVSDMLPPTMSSVPEPETSEPSAEMPEPEAEILTGSGEGAEDFLPEYEEPEEVVAEEGLKILVQRLLEAKRKQSRKSKRAGKK